MRRSWRCMAALLLMIMILVSVGLEIFIDHYVRLSEKYYADTVRGYNI